jgi:hypothetical protein
MTTATDRMVVALRAEHAAIFGYGVLGARLDAAQSLLALQAEDAHRSRRDALILLLTQKGVTAPAADSTYALPFPVKDQPSALKLAIHIEERTTAAWRAVVAETNGDERRMALAGLTDCAVRAVGVRKAAGVTPVTVPFPGR